MALSFCGKRLFLTRTTISLSKRNQGGYIILLPEIGEDLPEKNPLNTSDGLPEFNNITIENCRAAVAKQTVDFEVGVQDIEKKLQKNGCNDVFKQVFEPLEELGSPLDTTWGLAKTLYLGNSTLMPTTSYLAIHDRAKSARASKFNNYTIYNAVKESANNPNYKENSEQNRIINKFILEGKLNGLELNNKERLILTGHLNKLITERTRFRQKNEISTKSFIHLLQQDNVIREFPKEVAKLMCPDPKYPERGPWKVTLQPHIYLPVMQYSSDREVRWNVWNGLVTRGSIHRDDELSTSLHLEEIRYIRKEIAKLLGYETFAHMSMETKMAGSVENVKNMLQTLLDRAKPAQEKELANLHAFAAERGFKYDRLELWDVPYWRRKQASTLFDYDEQQIKEYFPLNKVLEGMFELCEKLFNIIIKQSSNASTWHKEVKFYDIFEQHSSAPVAGFYLDPYARSEDKIRFETNGWMVTIQNHSRITNTKPLAALIFNFEQPTGEQRHSNLSFNEVKSLFNKFGHALQHLLTRTNYSEVAGLSNVEWDAVEVSGHVLSHWLYNKSTIDAISCHYKSEDKLPDSLYKTLINVHQHMAGLDLSRELYLSALDLELHTNKEFWLDIIRDMWPQYRCFPLDKYDTHPCSFTQIFSEEWGAAYYSHVWSRMIAADVYSAFHEVRDDERQIVDVGKRFRDTFLALGGSMHSSQVFRQFRGRDPSPKALLSSLGLKKNKEI